jgi:hypothetical protein
VGGADLGTMVDQKWYPLYSVNKMVRFVQQTPLVDGTGLKNTLENRAAPYLDARLKDKIQPRRALIPVGVDRWGLSISFLEAGYECRFGDLLFGLGIPFTVSSAQSLKTLAALLMPIAGRLPFEWIYPTGKKQEERRPRGVQHYQWATVIAGDCHYVRRHMPDRLDGKIIVTNTTTDEDVAIFKAAGVRYLLTTTPVIEGRSFGTNMMEAALIAISGKGRKLSYAELNEMLDQLHFEPQLQELNPCTPS